MPKFPVVSGSQLIKLLNSLGYTIVRQRGSHVRLMTNTVNGEYHITVPLHDEIARGTLNDIITKVSERNSLS
ncbi:type II toxin-antitoxin system HicA family toxin [Methanoplanus limicola]|uniref:YcfA family protein n=1 Tax=Methanoplanus limicola DSM 2279 TaxID=937775 RepID=H1Z264_9EURY|nr:type II toxin-antitoxin system HicA family toxin [Methanoplanus limicola]EHQ36409.1 YcfA family protein [Methanoplanus limicola DSM 2279]